MVAALGLVNRRTCGLMSDPSDRFLDYLRVGTVSAYVSCVHGVQNADVLSDLLVLRRPYLHVLCRHISAVTFDINRRQRSRARASTVRRLACAPLSGQTGMYEGGAHQSIFDLMRGLLLHHVFDISPCEWQLHWRTRNVREKRVRKGRFAKRKKKQKNTDAQKNIDHVDA